MNEREPWVDVLRATTPASREEADATLQRVLARRAHWLRARSLRKLALFAAAGAITAVLAILLTLPAPSDNPDSVHREAPSRRAVDRPAPATPSPEVPLPATPALETPAPAPHAKRSRARPAVLVPAPAPAPAPAPVSEAAAPPPVDRARLDALFRDAHRKQYGAPPVAALAAWDAYLALHPEGSLAIEARYYRALTLLRLGRKDEARAELVPFARGDHGTFRQRDAVRWLSQLDGG